MELSFRPLSKIIGAEVLGVDLSQPVDRGTTKVLYAAWLEHLILLFRSQDLTQAELVAATEIFGNVGDLARPEEYQPKGQHDLHASVMLISNVREGGEPIGALPDGEMMFHHDMMHAAEPHKGTLLYAREIPSTGGNTLFANLYAAYDALPDSLRIALAGKRSLCSYNLGSVQKDDGVGLPVARESRHPVFRTHSDTGRKAIYVNRLMTVGVEGLPDNQAKRILGHVFDVAEQEQFYYEHVWRPGDVMLWDNRCTMHARTDFPPERRLFWRTTIAGNEVPY